MGLRREAFSKGTRKLARPVDARARLLMGTAWLQDGSRAFLLSTLAGLRGDPDCSDPELDDRGPSSSGSGSLTGHWIRAFDCPWRARSTRQSLVSVSSVEVVNGGAQRRIIVSGGRART